MTKDILKKLAKRTLRQTYYKNTVFHPRAEDKPFLVRMDVNNVCNQCCLKCYYPEYLKLRPSGHFLSVDNFRKIAQKLFNYTYYLQMPYGFEALLHPDFAALMGVVRSYAIPNVGIVTNGSMLEGEKASAILDTPSVTVVSISLDSIRRQTYCRMRGRDHLDRVLKNINSFQESKQRGRLSRPHLKINTVVMRSNLHELPSITNWCIESGVDELEFIFAEPHDYTNDESVVHCREEYNEVHDEICWMTANSSMLLSLPPRIKPAEVMPETGRLRRRHYQASESSEYETSVADTAHPDASHPYPRNVFCVCPWMTLIIDCWGNVFPCAHRTSLLTEIDATTNSILRHSSPHGNILYNSLYDTINSMSAMRLRRELLAGRHNVVCPFCTANSPSSDPMRHKHIRQLPEPQKESDEA